MTPVNTPHKKALRSRLVVGGMALAYGLLLGLGVAGFSGEAQALRITMKRVVFEGPKRADMIVLINNTNEEMTYRLGWRRMRMGEDEMLRELAADDPGADLRFADDMIKYAPRRVVLPAGGSQQVRLMLRRPKDLPDGEYRSHFWIEPEAQSVKFNPEDVKGDPAKGPAVQIKMLTGITLPVIVRVGDLKATGTLTDGRVTRKGDGATVNLVLNREGDRSLYGDFDFSCGGALVHQIRGIAVYTEVAKRNLAFNITAFPADCRQLDVTYKAAEDDLAFAGGTIAQTAIAVP